MLKTEKVVERLGVGVNGVDDIFDVVLDVKDGVGNRFLATEVDVLSKSGGRRLH